MELRFFLELSMELGMTKYGIKHDFAIKHGLKDGIKFFISLIPSLMHN